MSKLSMMNFKFHVINELLEVNEKFRTTVELTEKYKIPKSSLYNKLYGKNPPKWKDWNIKRINEKSYLVLVN